MPFQTDKKYLSILTEPIAACANYLPKFGHGIGKGYDLQGFQNIYGADPFYKWLGLDNPLMFAAHKVAGGMTSIYRQIGIGCERLFRAMLMDGLDLSEEQVVWSYSKKIAGGKTQTLYLDGRIEWKHVPDAEARKRGLSWMRQICDRQEVSKKIAAGLNGVVFEIRQGYKSKDSKRQSADLGNASTAYKNGYLPVVGVFSLQMDEDIENRYANANWIVLKGIYPKGDEYNSLYAFTKKIVGYDLAAFFNRNKKTLGQTVDQVLGKLLSPDGGVNHAPKK